MQKSSSLSFYSAVRKTELLLFRSRNSYFIWAVCVAVLSEFV